MNVVPASEQSGHEQTFFKMTFYCTLRKTMASLEVKPGICPTLVKLYKIKTQSITHHEKLASIFLDEVSLNEYIIHYVLYSDLINFDCKLIFIFTSQICPTLTN